MALEKIQRHRAWFVQIEEHSEAALARTADEGAQIFQPFLMLRASFRFPRKRRELVQHRLQPYAVDARLCEPRQIAIRIWISVQFEQWITVEREVGVAE